MVNVECLARWHVSQGEWNLQCVTCKHGYTGGGALRLARSLWDQVATREETDAARMSVANCLAIVLQAQGQFPEAARIHRETLEVRRRVLGAEHPDTRTSACDLAEVLRKERMTSAAIAPSAVWGCDRRDWTGLIVAALIVVGAVLWCAGGARSLGLHVGA